MAPLTELTSSVRPPPLPRHQAAGSRSFPSRYLSPPFLYLDVHGKVYRIILGWILQNCCLPTSFIIVEVTCVFYVQEIYSELCLSVETLYDYSLFP
jgi:hypothetical protein